MRLSHVALPSLFVLSCLGLSGCAGFKDAAPLPNASALVNPGKISGSNYGGHAPIAGAHLFVLQAVSATYGYGSKSTSSLTPSIPGATVDYTGSGATNPTYGMSFITTGADGSFNINGDYSCTSGDPVYLYASGGSESGAGATTATISQVTLAANASNSAYQTVTITTSTPENFVAGEPVTLNDFPTGLSIETSVLASPLTTTQFAVTIPTSLGEPNGTFTSAQFGNATVTGYLGSNPQTTNMAMLGLCPGTPGEFSNTLGYIYMNEVSTIAMAEAMAGFAGTKTTGVTTDAVHLGAPTTNLLGLQNAALNANQLYNVQGGDVVPGTSGGEAHVARAVTPAGNGIVPQSTLNTLGNILAACVDSANTYNPYPLTPAGTQSAACSTLLNDASSTGGTASGIAAIDTAVAAFNIAHMPAGSNTITNFMSDLFGLQGTSYPFGNNLTTQPNDFSIAIQYPLASTTNSTVANPAVNAAESIGIDASGNIWMNSHGNSDVFEFSPLGVLEYQSPSAAYAYGYVSVDPSGNVWTGTDFATGPETEFVVVTGNNGTQTVTPATYVGPFLGGFYDAYATVTDSSGNAYIGATSGATSNRWQLATISASGTASVLNSTPVIDGYYIAHSAVDSAGYVWVTTENGSEIGKYNESTGVAQFKILASPTNGLLNPEEPAVDANNNLWVANQHTGVSGGLVMRVTSAGGINTYKGGNQNNPFGVAVDGLNQIWVTNRCVTGCATTGTTGPFSSILEFNSSGQVISPANNYTLAGQISHPLNIAVDGSGVIWVTSYDSSMVGEVFGPAAPTVTPLSTASGNGGLGARP